MGIVEVGRGERIVAVNERFCGILGYRARRAVLVWNCQWFAAKGVNLPSVLPELTDSTCVVSLIYAGPTGGEMVKYGGFMTQPRDEGHDHPPAASRIEILGQLAANLAHDFNNIFSSIILNLEVMENEGDLPDHIAQPLRTVINEAHRGACSLRRLATLGQSIEPSRQPLELTEITGRALTRLRPLLGSDVQVRFERSPDPLWVEGDGAMLEQVIENLLLNAGEAMPQGGILSVSVGNSNRRDGECGTLDAEGSYACVSVSDTGHGMDVDIQARIFEPFFTTKRPGRLAGLGLVVARRIVEQHGGHIAAFSEPWQGSRFEVHLPVTEPGCTPPSKHVGGGGETLVFVEAEHALRRPAALLLRKLGYAVLEASGAAQASRIWEEYSQTIDLVIMSGGALGGEDQGHKLANEWRKQRPGLPVVLCAGGNDGPNAESEAEFSYLAKPYCAETLAAAVRRGLDNSTPGISEGNPRDET